MMMSFVLLILKHAPAGFERVRNHMKPTEGVRMKITEFMHPRAEEIVGLFPSGLGRRVHDNDKAMKLIDRLVNRGRRLRTDGLFGFIQLYFIGGLRWWRRRTFRHAIELTHLEEWLQKVTEYLAVDYDLAVEVIRNRRLIKGYSDTHARGMTKFDKAMQGAALVAGRPDAADWTRRLREAALLDEKGTALDGALQTIRSFADETAKV